ncbi:unnamed protein product [Chrysoparadoxa australica]
MMVAPFTIPVALTVPPVLAADAVLQWGADTPIGQKAQAATGEALQVAKLWWVFGKISAKQGLRLGKKEFERSGGLPGLASKAQEAAAGVIQDPVGSAQAW